MQNAKTFRLFISSTFNDFRLERQVLHEKIFPVIEILKWYLDRLDVEVKSKVIEITNNLVPVFISTISPHTPEQVFFQEDFYYKLVENGMRPVKVEFI